MVKLSAQSYTLTLCMGCLHFCCRTHETSLCQISSPYAWYVPLPHHLHSVFVLHNFIPSLILPAQLNIFLLDQFHWYHKFPDICNTLGPSPLSGDSQREMSVSLNNQIETADFTFVSPFSFWVELQIFEQDTEACTQWVHFWCVLWIF